MNPYLCRVVLRPRGAFEVFDLALRLSRERWSELGAMALWTVAPLALGCAILSWWTSGSWWVLAIPLVAAPVVQAPFTLLGGRLLFHDHVPARGVIADTLKRLPALAGAWAAVAVALGASAGISCFALAPVAQGALLYVTEAALLERADPAKGAVRSMRLAGAQVGHAAAAVAGRWGLTLWCALVGEAVGQAVVGFVLQLGAPFGSLGAGQATPFLLAGVLLSHPIWALYRLLLYVDARTRTEGWDLQVGLRAAGMAR